jgi:hypothetical protein
MAGRYFQQHGDDATESEAHDKVTMLLEGWRVAMGGLQRSMARADGSALRDDDLRVVKLTREQRSAFTKDDILSYVSPSQRADYAIGIFHNLMQALDHMLVNSERTEIRLHLSAEYVVIRALIEAATSALWILGPEVSDQRITNAFRLRYDELEYSKRLTRAYARHSGLDEARSAEEAQTSFVSGQLLDLELIAESTGISFEDVKKGASPSLVAAEGGGYVPELGAALTFWYWSTASSIAHGEPTNINMLSDMKLLGVDERDEPIAHVEPSSVSVYNHLQVALDLIQRAHELWNQRANDAPDATRPLG